MKDPKSHIQALAMVASSVTVNSHIPIGRYFRSGSEMLKMAKMYHDEGELENAFILYTKYTTLFVEQIPKHPEYRTLTDKDKFETTKVNLSYVAFILKTIPLKNIPFFFTT
nr:STAM-binding protein-like [Parasteatoda tepidariorum]